MQRAAAVLRGILHKAAPAPANRTPRRVARMRKVAAVEPRYWQQGASIVREARAPHFQPRWAAPLRVGRARPPPLAAARAPRAAPTRPHHARAVALRWAGRHTWVGRVLSILARAARRRRTPPPAVAQRGARRTLPRAPARSQVVAIRATAARARTRPATTMFACAVESLANLGRLAADTVPFRNAADAKRSARHECRTCTRCLMALHQLAARRPDSGQQHCALSYKIRATASP